MTHDALTPDPWTHLAHLTSARIALGRAGSAMPTREVLRFALAHAQARDAVHAPFASDKLAAKLHEQGLRTVEVSSKARDRTAYLRRPDWGRMLDANARVALDVLGKPGGDVVIVVADGLSATAVHGMAVPVVEALRPKLGAAGLGLGPVVIATGARVALGDEIAYRVGARAVLVLIGERPGLSAPDSLGAYLTFDPKPGRHDAERNCVSNIRAGGLTPERAAFKLCWLLTEAFRRGLTGVDLKDQSDLLLGAEATKPALG
jgi:ethanolamine ammonia-lyase small subunit